MAAFSYQDLPLLVDCVLTPNMVMKLSSSSSSASPSYSNQTNPSFHGNQLHPFYPFGNLVGFHEDQLNPFDCSVHESSCVDQGTAMAAAYSTPASSDNELSSLTAKQSKRKLKGDGSSPNSASSKDVRGGRNKKQRKSLKHEKEEDEEKNRAPLQEPPKGYIHVRARRGQATDSHSLAERVRREKISERMKLLQGLVPGCDKVTGKATMLDEIINYVQSLQSQVEFLSMKLASFSPVFYNFGTDLETLMFDQQGSNNMTPPLAPMQQCSPTTTIATASTTTGFHGVEAPILFQQQQAQQREEANPTCLQDNVGSLYWEVEGLGGPGPTNQSGLCNSNNIMY